MGRTRRSWRARHVQVLSWYLGMLMYTAERVIAFRLKLECPRGETIAEKMPGSRSKGT